jgi:hypothetical protein
MGQEWLFQIHIEPKEGEFDKVAGKLENKTDLALFLNKPFKEPKWDFDKKDNTIDITVATHAGYKFGEQLVDDLNNELGAFIESGRVEIWEGDYPQKTKKLGQVI